MKEWERAFSSTILARGRDYQRRGRVGTITKKGNLYTASVRGLMDRYNIALRMNDGELLGASCTCPYAENGQRCKHMAAVLYALDAREEQNKASQEPAPARTTVTPFRRGSAASGEYRYFDITKIAAKTKIYEDIYEAAGALLERDPAEPQLRFFYEGYGSARTLTGELHTFFPSENARTFLRFTRNELISAGCSCRMAGVFSPYRPVASRELCVHQTAAMIQLDRYIEDVNPGDATDYTAALLLGAFRQTRAVRKLQEESGDAGVIQMEPRLLWFGDRLELAFRVGLNKLYVLRNISEFVDAAENSGSWPLGKNAELDFAAMSFAPESEPYYRLARRAVEEERYRAVHLGNTAAADRIKESIPLYGALLDDFFDMSVGKSFPCVDRSDANNKREFQAGFREADPQISLTVKQDLEKKVFHGIQVEGRAPELLRGAEYNYFVDDAGLNRVSPDFIDMIEPLTALSRDGDISFRVGRRNLSEFYYSVLPALRERVEVLEPDEESIAAYLTPEAAFVFYLDAREGVPVCRILVEYGEKSYSGLDWLREGFVDRNFRDAYREREVLMDAADYFPEHLPEEDELRSREDEDSIYRVLSEGVDVLLGLGEVQSTDRFRALRARKKVRVSVGVSVESGLMDLQIRSEDVSQEELLDILNSYREKKKYHRLRSGEFVDIDESIEELGDLADTMRLTPKEIIAGRAHLPAYRALYLDKLLEGKNTLYTDRDRHYRELVRQFRTVDEASFEVPDSLKNILRSYQEYGYKWLRTLAAYGFGGILADDMGLGKTLQVITVLLAAKEEGNAGTSIVITPASLVFNWQEEFARFAPSLSVCVVAGSQKERAAMIADHQKYDVLVTSYDLLKRDIASYEDCAFRFQVIDEGQFIKNHSTAAAKSVKVIKSDVRYALTGTPIENRLSELWSIFDYLMPGFLYGYETFRRELETPIVRNQDDAASERLRRMVSPFILRRLKSDVLRELPEKMEETRGVTLTDAQRTIYDAQVLRMRAMLAGESEDSFRRGKLQILAELTKLRQICCDPGLTLEDYDGGSAKREACIELIESAVEGEHRVLLFSQFTTMLERLAEDLRARDIEYYEITGATPKRERVELVRRFNTGNVPVFLISLKAGGTGLNLTGADVVIHYDPWWNLAAQNQATDRAHRIGQEKVVTVYKLIARDTVEEKIQQLQRSKQELADAILNEASGGIASMTKDDILRLLE